MHLSSSILEKMVIHNGSTIISDGIQDILNVGSKEINLIINILGPVTGTNATLQFFISEIDPVDHTTIIGVTKISNIFTNVDTQIVKFPVINSGAVQVSWVITGTNSPTFNNVNCTLASKMCSTSLLYDESGKSLGTQYNPMIIEPPKYFTTPFGELRTAPAHTLYDGTNIYKLDPLEWGTLTTSGGAINYNTTSGLTSLSVTNANGDRAVIRTHTYFRYKAGHSLRIKLTVIHIDYGQLNQVRRWGYFDDNNGVFFQLSGTTLSVVRRTSISGLPIDNTSNQSEWIHDKLDGTGPSGITLDITKNNIYEINLQWLSAGRIIFYVNGILVHTIICSNTLSEPSLRLASLPVEIEIINTNTSTASNINFICSSVSSDGNGASPKYSYSAYNSSIVSVGVTEIPILSIRPTALFNSSINRMLIVPLFLSIRTEGARIGFKLILNPTLTGASFTSVNVNSGQEYDVSATAFSGGEVILLDFLGQTNDAIRYSLEEFFGEFTRKLRRNAFNTDGDILTITAVNEIAGTTNVRASLTSGEIR